MRYPIPTILNPKENKKLENDYGHNEEEWGHKDESEDIEWDQHYHDRNKKWRFKDEPEDEGILDS